MAGRPPPRRAASLDLSELPKEARPLRAKSVSLAIRPLSKYGRPVNSADSTRIRFIDKKLFPRQLSVDSKPRRPSAIPGVKPLNRKIIEKIPFAINVQNLSIPTKYGDKQKARHSTSKPSNVSRRVDGNKTKLSNPVQVDNKRLCETLGGKETQNKLLEQISEAEQVSDFERILNSNAILSERQRHVWRGCAAHKPSASVVLRPRSAYSLYAVSQTYHYLFQQHEETLQPLIEEYRNARADNVQGPQTSFINQNWYENINDLTEFYEDDQDLKKEVETITDQIITEEVSESKEPNKRHKYFNVNLADLFGIRVNGEGCTPNCDDLGPSPDIDKPDNEEEWRSSMSANSDERQNPQENVDCLAQSLDSVKINSDASVPTITFSNCCDGCAKSEKPDNTNVVIHLAVPSIDSDEARPPIM